MKSQGKAKKGADGGECEDEVRRERLRREGLERKSKGSRPAAVDSF